MISNIPHKCAVSICLSPGSNWNDKDHGDKILYYAQKSSIGLVNALKEKKPVRVIRKIDDKRYRYDGLFYVVAALQKSDHFIFELTYGFPSSPLLIDTLK